MYKRIGKFSFKEYSFIPAIEKELNYYSNKVMNRFSFGIYKTFIEYSEKWNENQKKCLLEILHNDEWVNLDKLSETQTLLILSQIINLRMEEYLKVPMDEIHNGAIKQNHLTFDEFKASENSSFNFSEEIHKIFKSNRGQFESIPEYFKLYKMRNLILSVFDRRPYSENTLSKVVERISDSFIEDLCSLIVLKNVPLMESKNVHNIVKRVINDYIMHFLNYQLLGKTMLDGQSQKKMLSEKIFSSNVYASLLTKVAHKYETSLIDLLNEDNYVERSEELIREIKNSLVQITGESKVDLSIITFEDFKKIILGEVFQEVECVNKHLEAAYQDYNDEMIVDKILQISNDYLSVGEFEIALMVKNISTTKSFFYSEVSKDITAISHELFKGWQYEKNEELGYKTPNIIDTTQEEQENSMYFIIKNLNCAIKDEDMVYFLAKQKLETYLEFYYYFMSKEDDYNFVIGDPYIIFNKTRKRMTVGRKNNHINTKYFDEFPKELIEFPTKFIESSSVASSLMQCVKLYYSTMKERDVLKKSQNLVKIWRTVFDTSDDKTLAKYCAITIAGINYNKSDVTYGQMRQILFEDFTAFIYYSSHSSPPIIVIDESFERFKVFTKNIIGTYLFNLSSEEDEVIDILKWILYINPNDEYIKSGVTEID